MLRYFRRKESLPLASHSRGIPDGSGRSVHMEAPLHRAWRNANPFVKGTYISLVVSLFVTYWGYRNLRSSHASLWLSCRSMDCTLDINNTGRRHVSVTFARRQLVKVEAVKVNSNGQFVKVDDTPTFDRSLLEERRQRKKKGKKYKRKPPVVESSQRGPDKEGNYPSYQILLKQPERDGHYDQESEDDEEDQAKDGDVNVLLSAGIHARKTEDGQIAVHMRPFNFIQSRKRPRSTISRLESYIKRRRHKSSIKETKGLSWKGILALILGIFAVLMTVLIGQFVNEHTPHQAGPGVRRQQQGQKPKQQPTRKKPSYVMPPRASTYQRTTTPPAAVINPRYSATAATTVRRKGY